MTGNRLLTLLQKRHHLIKKREYLKNLRAPYLFGVDELGAPLLMPPELQIPWDKNEREFGELCIETQHIFLRLLDKLPRCSECQKLSLHRLQDGPYLCDLHAQRHPTATEVPWAPELRELGIDKEP